MVDSECERTWCASLDKREKEIPKTGEITLEKNIGIHVEIIEKGEWGTIVFEC